MGERTMTKWVGRALPAVAMMLFVTACGDTSTPTATGATSVTQAQPSLSAVVRGLVTDGANRPVANANVECASSAHCRRYTEVSVQDGPDESVTTNADGRYQMIVVASSADFLMNASANGYSVVWQQVRVPDATCSFDQERCAVTANFVLVPTSN